MVVHGSIDKTMVSLLIHNDLIMCLIHNDLIMFKGYNILHRTKEDSVYSIIVGYFYTSRPNS